jgi:rhodanese-related sulfurtransferase
MQQRAGEDGLVGWFSRLGAPSQVDIDVAEARRRQERGALLVDVREPDEWQAGHAPGAVHVPLGSLARRADELPRDQDVLLICRSGNRSGSARNLLAQHGFERAFNVAGGMLAWTRAGFPTRSGQ